MTMVSFKNLSTLANKAKEVVEQRGGADSLKEDAEQLKGIAKGPGSLTDKAKAAAEALKRPGEEAEKEAPEEKAAKPRAKAKTGAGKPKKPAAK
jgi:hypothetical protein